MRIWSRLIALPLLLAATPSLAAEVSLLTGLYQNDSSKVNGTDDGSKTVIGVGGRYAQPLNGPLFWFAQGDLALESYSKGSAPDSPSNATNLDAGGGVRYYFNKLSDRFEPYAQAKVLFRSSKDATTTAAGYTETDKNGLYYSADFGIRIILQKEFFVDLEANLFESGLFATEKQITAVYSTNGTATTTVETQRTELYAQTSGPLNGVNVALGYRF